MCSQPSKVFSIEDFVKRNLDTSPARKEVQMRDKKSVETAVLRPRVLISSAKAAQLLNVSVRTVVEWANRWQDSGGMEGLEGLKIGKQWQFEKKLILEIASGVRRVILGPAKPALKKVTK
jgi:DNA-binding transcriptional regulator YiaG